MPTCAINGCDRERVTRGWCRMHYQRWLKFKDPLYTIKRPPGLTPAEIVKYELGRATREPNGCIIPTSYQGPTGRAVINFRNKPVLLNRLVLQVKLGRELQGDEQANHSCYTAACANPDHLHVGTKQDSVEHFRQAGLAFGRKLTVAKVRKIRRLLAAGEKRAKIAKRFRVSTDTVRLIALDERWRDVS